MMKKNKFIKELYLRYLSINIKSIMVYDIDYLVGIIAMIIKSVVNFCLLLILFQLVDNINGWTFNEMLFLYGFSEISYALWHCCFIDTITIPTYIQTGEFDRFLTKPVNPLFQIMMEAFDEDGWGELFFGIIIMIISIVRLNLFSWKLLLLPFMCIAACLIFASMSIICSSVAFYTIGNIDLTDNVMDFKEFAKYPMSIFNSTLQIVFTCILPIGFTAYYPSLMFLRNTGINTIVISLITIPVAIVFFILSCKWWNFSLKKYNSSGY